MATNKIYDSHFHLLFKHFIKPNTALNDDVRVGGIAQVLDEISGGVFDSQSSPNLISQSQVFVGVTSLLAVEHAFANKILHLEGIDFSFLLKLDKTLFTETKEGKRTYYAEFLRQLKFYLDAKTTLAGAPYKIEFLQRNDNKWAAKTQQQIEDILSKGDKRYFALAMEGGHNLSNVPIRSQTMKSMNPEIQLQEIQDRQDADIMSMNLCHLSFIPEQPLAGFAQGLTKEAQTAFKSDDFMPKTGLGITQLGKRVIRQALSHATKPILIDVKHMSAYSRFHYYRFRDKLIEENSEIQRLPILSSHTGFTFISMQDYAKNKNFQSNTYSDEEGNKVCELIPENRFIGKTNDKRNSDLYANPWSIGLFDEEITEIMRSNGLIGVSMDQRVLGAVKMMDGNRKGYYEKEFIAEPEWQKLFIDGKFPTAEEGLFERIFGAPTRAERHIMLFCLHMVHAVRIGNASLPWVGGSSPWDHLSIGSDYDGLINPLNGYKSIADLHKMADDLYQYIPLADKLISSDGNKALKYNDDGNVNDPFLRKVIDDVLFNNGVRFTARFLKNWK